MNRPVVLFESPHRIGRLLADIRSILAERPIIVGRELTKLHEDITRTTSAAVDETKITPRGEFTIVLGPKTSRRQATQAFKDKDVAEFFYQLTKSTGMGRRPALTQTASEFGLSTKFVYDATKGSD